MLKSVLIDVRWDIASETWVPIFEPGATQRRILLVDGEIDSRDVLL